MTEPRPFGLHLPDYPWDAMVPYREIASRHPDGVVDLSIGTPVDPTPDLVRAALAGASDAPGYPTTHGTLALREAISGWFARRRGVPGLDPQYILPTVGSKELVAWLPLLLGLGKGDVVVRPRVAYPTYDVGAHLAGATPVAADSLEDLPSDVRSRVRLVWVNSPGNPTGEVLDVDGLRSIVDTARSLGAVVASDECYGELGWGRWDPAEGGEPIPSILDPRVSGDSHHLLLAVYSLSKQSNLAGYRAAFTAGDPDLIATLVNSRKHAGMIVPHPVQEATRVALGDDAHVAEQKDRYRRRRAVLVPALQAAGFTISGSEAGLYLWASDGTPTWDAIAAFAELGILAGPGVFYGEAGNGFVRVALTGSDERVDAAARRLAGRGR